MVKIATGSQFDGPIFLNLATTVFNIVVNGLDLIKNYEQYHEVPNVIEMSNHEQGEDDEKESILSLSYSDSV
jgi:hypothetical protein